MSGIPKFNFPVFDREAEALRQQGYEVWNPADKDRELYGPEIGESEAGDQKEAIERYGFDPRTTIRTDLNMIIDWADVVALLSGWRNSKGARLEYDLAVYLGLEIWELTERMDVV